MSGDLVVGDFHGYRAWGVNTDDGLLRPVTYRSVPWSSSTERATCRVDTDHAAPVAGCTCGLYAYYRASTVPVDYRAHGTVFGVVAVRGRVILASRGMKAEQMTILALATDDAALGERYGVPIYPSREALLSDYPPQDYSELVDVDPDDSMSPGLVFHHIGVSASGLVRQMGKIAQQMAAMEARTNAATEEVSRAISAIASAAGPTPGHDVMAKALERRKNRHTGPTVGRYRPDGSRG